MSDESQTSGQPGDDGDDLPEAFVNEEPEFDQHTTLEVNAVDSDESMAGDDVDDVGEEPMSSDRDPRDAPSPDSRVASSRLLRSIPLKGWLDLADELARLDSDEEKEQMLAELTLLADAIWKIVQEKIDNGGRALRGRIKEVAETFQLSVDQVGRLVDRIEAHDRERRAGKPVGPRVNAILKGRPGRRKGKRTLPPEVEQFIIDLWRTSKHKSLNVKGETDPIRVNLARRMVHKAACRRFTHVKVSETTCWRIIDDFEQKEVVKNQWSRGKKKDVSNNLLTVDVDFIAVNHFWILDIRPLPIRSRHKKILCTAGLLQILEAFSTLRLRQKILPRQDVDDKGETFGVDFTCRQVRLELALAILIYRIRPRIIYVDNGTQFGPALEKFIDLLTPEGEPHTEIIHSERGEPRGRGVIERALALINSFIQYKPGFFPEGDYYTALEKPKNFKYYEFKVLEDEFDHYLPIWNDRTSTEGLTPKQRYEQGPNHGYPPPSELQLGLFGGSVQKIKDGRKISREGVRVGNAMYVPASDSPEIGANLVSAALDKQKREVLVVEINELRFLYVKLDGKNWTPFIKKSERRVSSQRQKQYKDQVKAYLDTDQKACEERLQLAMLNHLGEELVIDPYREEWVWHKPSQASRNAAQQTPEGNGTVQPSPEPPAKTGTDIDLQIMILEEGENQTGSLMVHSRLQRPESGQEASRGTDYNL